MSKFHMGEACEVFCTHHKLWESCTIVGLPGCSRIYPDHYRVETPGCHPSQFRKEAYIWSAPENQLRKLPPDDSTRTQDTSEDPGLTRIKKLLEQDKQPVTTKEKT